MKKHLRGGGSVAQWLVQHEVLAINTNTAKKRREKRNRGGTEGGRGGGGMKAWRL